MTDTRPVGMTISLALLTIVILLLAVAQEGSIDASDDIQQLQQQQEGSEEFAHLLNVANGYGERVRILSEIVQDGVSVQVEEFLDLASMNQLIQFKWHGYEQREAAPGGQKESNRLMLKTRKLNVVILNSLGKGEEDKSLMYQYEPYKCDMTVLGNTDATSKAHDWHTFKLGSQEKVEDLPKEKIYSNLINSLKSMAPNSPYLTRIVSDATRKASIGVNTTPAKTTQTNQTAWLLGVAGLWAKAQYNNQLVGRMSLGPSGLSAWRLEVADEFLVDYFMEEAPANADDRDNSEKKAANKQKSARGNWYRARYQAPNMIEIASATGPVVDSAIQIINVIQADFHFSDRLARNLFKLPVGFNCPVLPPTGRGLGNVYVRDQVSQLVELEVVLNMYDDNSKTDDGSNSNSDSSNSLYSNTEIKNIQLARVKHPLNSNSRLVMVQSHEDRYKLVLDYHYNLEYHISSKGTGTNCEIRHISRRMNGIDGSSDAAGAVSSSSNILYFSGGILFDLNEFHLNYILGQRDEIVDSGGTAERPSVDLGRLLNVFAVSERENELVYEAQVPEVQRQMLTPMDHAQRLMTIVRIYKQQLVPKRSILDGSVRLIASGPVELKRVMILMFNLNRSKRLAEIRLNLVGDSHQMLSLTKRAKLFDLSQCYDDSEQTMQITATYPADPRLLDYIRDNSHELLESFYHQASNWRTLGDFLPTMTTSSATATVDNKRRQLDETARDRQRLGMSLNYLRVPRAELFGSPSGDLELRLTVLDKVAPLTTFGHVKQATFIVNSSRSFGNSSNSSSFSPTSSTHDDTNSLGTSTFLLENINECSRYCQIFDCKVFAFDWSGECKLSRLPLLGVGISKANQRQRAAASVHLSLTLKTSSQVYFEREFMQDPTRFAGEASLVELSSYMEHYSDELTTFFELASEGGREDDVDADHDSMGGVNRRSARIKRFPGAGNRPEANKPVFAFDFVDRSNLASEYAPPSYRLLVPSELSVTKAPLATLNTGEARQMQQMARTFATKWHFKEFTLTALDELQGQAEMVAAAYGPPPQLLFRANKNERVFRNKAERIYFTLRQMFAMNQDNCALVCHNIDQWNSARNSEQVCVGFSYSALNRRCVLAIKTDYDFVDSLLDLADEGDRVLAIESLEQLLGDSDDGLVAMRNYLTHFEGPIRLVGPNFHGETTTSGGKFDPLLELEWLQAIATETSFDQAQEISEKCAQACLDRNKRGKLCLAFDFCAIDTPSPSSGAKLDASDFAPAVQHGTTCELLFVRDYGRRQTGRGKRIGELRTYLTQTTQASGEGNIGVGAPEESTSDRKEVPKVVVTSRCSRYLLSHIADFNHLSQRQLAPPPPPVDKDGGQSASPLRTFEKLTETEHELNVDKCALECSLRGARCVLFEFCLSLPKQTDQLQEQQGLSSSRLQQLFATSCSLYTVSSSISPASTQPWRTATKSRDDSGAKLTNGSKDSTGDESNRPLSSFSRDCHVYLRKQYDSLEDALAVGGPAGASDDPDDTVSWYQESGQIGGKFQHFTLSIVFASVYLLVIVLILLYVTQRMRLCAAVSQQELTSIVEIQLNER